MRLFFYNGLLVRNFFQCYGVVEWIGFTHITPALLFEFPEALDLGWGEVVQGCGDETPWSSVEVRGELVQFAEVGVLKDRPCKV